MLPPVLPVLLIAPPLLAQSLLLRRLLAPPLLPRPQGWRQVPALVARRVRPQPCEPVAAAAGLAVAAAEVERAGNVSCMTVPLGDRMRLAFAGHPAGTVDCAILRDCTLAALASGYATASLARLVVGLASHTPPSPPNHHLLGRFPGQFLGTYREVVMRNAGFAANANLAFPILHVGGTPSHIVGRTLRKSPACLLPVGLPLIPLGVIGATRWPEAGWLSPRLLLTPTLPNDQPDKGC